MPPEGISASAATAPFQPCRRFHARSSAGGVFRAYQLASQSSTGESGMTLWQLPQGDGTWVESGSTAEAGLIAGPREDGSPVRGGDPSSGLITLPERSAT